MTMGILERLVALYAPHLCVGCEAEGATLCDDCRRQLPALVACCYRCRVGTVMGETCLDCQAFGIDAVSAATRYTGAAKAVVHQLKFGRAREAAHGMALAMVAAYHPRIHRTHAATRGRVLVVPAPTASSRIRMRGYDQAALLAKSFARQSGLAYAPLLMRSGNQRQVGASRAQRQIQLKSAFYVASTARIRGAHIILVDDVLTTGSTIEAAAATMRAAGAHRVEAVVFARA